jgi:hypothetical protein
MPSLLDRLEDRLVLAPTRGGTVNIPGLMMMEPPCRGSLACIFDGSLINATATRLESLDGVIPVEWHLEAGTFE